MTKSYSIHRERLCRSSLVWAVNYLKASFCNFGNDRVPLLSPAPGVLERPPNKGDGE